MKLFSLMGLAVLLASQWVYADTTVIGSEMIQNQIRNDMPNEFRNVLKKTWVVRCASQCTGITIVPSANFSIVPTANPNEFHVTLLSSGGLRSGHNVVKIELIAGNTAIQKPIKPIEGIAVVFQYDDGTAIDVDRLSRDLGENNVSITIDPSNVASVKSYTSTSVLFERRAGNGSTPAKATLQYTDNGVSRTAVGIIPTIDDGYQWADRNYNPGECQAFGTDGACLFGYYISKPEVQASSDTDEECHTNACHESKVSDAKSKFEAKAAEEARKVCTRIENYIRTFQGYVSSSVSYVAHTSDNPFCLGGWGTNEVSCKAHLDSVTCNVSYTLKTLAHK